MTRKGETPNATCSNGPYKTSTLASQLAFMNISTTSPPNIAHSITGYIYIPEPPDLESAGRRGARAQFSHCLQSTPACLHQTPSSTGLRRKFRIIHHTHSPSRYNSQYHSCEYFLKTETAHRRGDGPNRNANPRRRSSGARTGRRPSVAYLPQCSSNIRGIENTPEFNL